MKEKLPREIVWEAEHLSEIALTAVADGEGALLGEEQRARAEAHLDACGECSARLGDLALLSLRTGEALASAGIPAQAHGAERAVSPARPLGIALAVAALGALPLLIELPSRASVLTASLASSIPIVVRSSMHVTKTLSEELGRASPLVSVASALVLLLACFAVVRGMPRPQGVSS
jgi:hypothetical protein